MVVVGVSCPDENAIVAYAAGRCAPELAARLERHLDGCSICATLVADAARATHEHDGPAVTRPRIDEPQAGTRVGRYVVLGVLGRGGMGTVLLARDPRLARDVAIKLLRRRAIGLTDGAVRLAREARIMAQLAHPHVVGVFELGVADGRVYVVMELVHGTTLRTWLEHPRDVEAIVAMLGQAGRGLAAAHAAGLLHRDFKPDNVMVGDDGRARVGDFGLAQSFGHAGETGASASGSSVSIGSGETRLTRAGDVMGTPLYMAPEQHVGDPVDARADQFAFCVVAYEALWSCSPFRGRTFDDLARAKLRGPEPPPAEPAVPGHVRRAVLRGLARAPSDRHADMPALLRALAPSRSRRLRSLALAAGGAGALALVLGIDRRAAGCDRGIGELAAVWNDDVRGDLQRAIADDPRPHVHETLARVTDGIDAWSSTWIRAHAAACDVAHARTGPLVCLEHARLELAALGELLVDVDDDVLLRAVRAVAELPDPTGCLAAASSREPAPDDAGHWQQLAEIRALAHAGRAGDAWLAAERLAPAALTTDDPRLRVEIRLWLARTRQRASEFESAEAAAAEAYFGAQDTADASLVADAAITMLAIVVEAHPDPSDAEPWVRHAEAAIAAAGDDPRDRATLHKALSNIALRRGDYELSRREAERGLALVVSALGDDHLDVADFTNNLANVAFAQGDYPEAIELNLRALEIRRDLLGPHHPLVGDSYNNLGAANYNLGRYRESVEDHAQALAIWERAHGRIHVDVAASHNNLGGAYHALGELSEALAHDRASIEIWSEALSPDHPDVAFAWNNLGNVLHALGRDDEARAAYQRALAIRERALGSDHPDVAFTLVNLGVVLDGEGDLPRARAAFEQAAASLERSLGPDHPTVATTLDNLGLVLRKQGELARAVEIHDRALAIHRAKLGTEHPQTATTEYGLGRALLAAGDRRAIEHLERACAGTPPDDPKLLDERLGVLADARARLDEDHGG